MRVLVAQEMTDNLSRVRIALRRPRTGISRLELFDVAARTALQLLEQAKSDRRTTDDPCEFVIFFASIKINSITGEPANADLLRRAGQLLRAGDRLVITGCAPLAFNWAQCGFTKEIASAPRYYVEAPDSTKLATLVQQVLDDYSHSRTRNLRQLDLSQRLQPALSYIYGSANPPPSAISQNGDYTVLHWEWTRDRIKLGEPYTVTYRAKPVQAGTWTISGELSLTDSINAHRLIPVPTHVITATDEGCNPVPTPAPTDMPTSPPPSDTPNPTDTPAPPTASATDTPSSTPTPQPIYVPLLLREPACQPGQQHVDVALVIDASSSMLEPTAAGRLKIEAAREAAREFVGLLAFPTDQAAIVWFNEEAVIEQGLTSDPARLEAALGRIATRPQTRIDLGIAAGLAALEGPERRAANQAVMIVLTDGRSNPVPASVAVERAAEAKARGVTIFTIGVGNEVDEAALREIASREWYAYRVQDAESLVAIYRQIAVTIPCPAEMFWPR